jgi:hypothetical protein
MKASKKECRPRRRTPTRPNYTMLFPAAHKVFLNFPLEQARETQLIDGRRCT